MKKFNTQIENAFEQKKCTNLLILGDVNLCADIDRWHSPKFFNKKVATTKKTDFKAKWVKIGLQKQLWYPHKQTFLKWIFVSGR